MRTARLACMLACACAGPALLAGLLAGLMAGCDDDYERVVDPESELIDWNRMFEQARFDVYEPSPYFPDGTIMRHPPEGTVPRSRPVVPPVVSSGMLDGAPGTQAEPVGRVPLPVTEALLRRGQNRYEIFCATCHGLTGTGNTQVAENMRLRPPPSLVLPPVSEYPAGRIFRVISEGYGLMRAYDAELPLADRWAVVAYVQALQLGQRIALEDLPPTLQTEAMTWLR